MNPSSYEKPWWNDLYDNLCEKVTFQNDDGTEETLRRPFLYRQVNRTGSDQLDYEWLADQLQGSPPDKAHLFAVAVFLDILHRRELWDLLSQSLFRKVYRFFKAKCSVAK